MATSWSLLVVRDLAFKGKRRFSELRDSDEGIATNILTDRLNRLEAARVITKLRDPEDGRRFVYSLTERGKDLMPVLHRVHRMERGARPRNVGAGQLCAGCEAGPCWAV